MMKTTDTIVGMTPSDFQEALKKLQEHKAQMEKDFPKPDPYNNLPYRPYPYHPGDCPRCDPPKCPCCGRPQWNKSRWY